MEYEQYDIVHTSTAGKEYEIAYKVVGSLRGNGVEAKAPICTDLSSHPHQSSS